MEHTIDTDGLTKFLTGKSPQDFEDNPIEVYMEQKYHLYADVSQGEVILSQLPDPKASEVIERVAISREIADLVNRFLES